MTAPLLERVRKICSDLFPRVEERAVLTHDGQITSIGNVSVSEIDARADFACRLEKKYLCVDLGPDGPSGTEGPYTPANNSAALASSCREWGFAYLRVFDAWDHDHLLSAIEHAGGLEALA